MYNKLKPDSGPSPTLDASIIQTNFSDYATIFSANHIAMNDLNQGAHGQVIFENQVSDPGVTQDLAALYNKNATSNASTEPQLFVQIPKFLPTNLDPVNAQNTGMQLTYNSVNTNGPVFQSFLPGGYLFYFGVVTGNSVPNVLTIIDIFLSPIPTKIITAIATPNTMTSVGTAIPFTVSTDIVSNSQFQIYSSTNGSSPTIPYSFTWSAIAKA